MPVDSSIYFQQQTPDLLGSFEKGMRLSDLMKDRNEKNRLRSEEEAVRNAYTSSIEIGPDGKPKVNQNLVLSQLAKTAPSKFIAEQEKFQTMESTKRKQMFEEMGQKFDYTGRVLGAVGDQPSWTMARNDLITKGIARPEELPEGYDPNLKQRVQMMALNAKEQITHQFQKEEALRDQTNKDRAIGIEKEKLGIERQKAGATAKKESGALATELRKERSGLPTTKATQEVSAAFNKIQKAAANPSPAGDMSLIFNYMKMLDPGSTVREGEYATASQATNVPSQVLNMYNRIVSGERMNPQMRADFVGQSKGLYQSQMDIQNQVDSQFSGLARKAGVDPNEVLLNFQANQPGPKPGQIEDGYRYKGGDPGEQSSWEKVK